MPEDIALAIPYIIELIEAFNIPVLMVDRYEADDVIGTLSYRASLKKIETICVTADKDYYQLFVKIGNTVKSLLGNNGI